MYNGIEYRGFKQELVEELAENSTVPVWNGLTDSDHPTQMLADFMTLKEHFGENGLKSEIVRQHKRETCQRKHGKNHYTQTDEYKNMCHKKKIKRFIENVINDPEIEFLNLLISLLSKINNHLY